MVRASLPVEIRENVGSVRVVRSPVSEQLARDRKQIHDLDASGLHALQRVIRDPFIERSASLQVYRDMIALGTHGQRQMGNTCGESTEASLHSLRDQSHMGALTDVRRYASDDDLAPVGRLHSIFEILVVPGIDLTRSTNERRVGIHLQELFRKWPIRPALEGRRHDHWNVEQLSQGRMAEHGVLVVRGTPAMRRQHCNDRNTGNGCQHTP